MSIGNDKNPTAVQDEINANLDEIEQYPSPEPPVMTLDTNELDIHQEYPQELDLNYTCLRCSRERYPTLADAQGFFNARRQLAVDNGCAWRHEAAIFRTARYWVKRIVL